ncbi:MAG: ferritin [Planctomycetota bacterium]|nr:ferritin [Planctomycetota bacterium]
MAISNKVSAALNQQISNELSAAYSYLAMSFSFDSLGLSKFAARFREQALEERDHAMKFASYIQDVGGSVTLEAIPKPKGDYKSVKELVQAAVASEIAVTNQIHAILDLAISDNDHATQSFLKWFVDEQVEEVSSMQGMLNLVEMAGDVNLLLLEGRIAGGPGVAKS